MSIDSRLRTIQKQIDDNAELFQVMPDFSKFSETELIQYNVKWNNEFIFQNRLNSFAEAENLLKSELSKDLISEEHYKLIVESLREHFDNANLQNDDSPVFFVP